MNDIEIIENIQKKLTIPIGRHLYGIIGTYDSLIQFVEKLQQAKTPDGSDFPPPFSLTRGILDAFSDQEFKKIVTDEAKRPEPTQKSIEKEFENVIRQSLSKNKLVVFKDLELLWAYKIDLNPLRTLATDDKRIIVLLPGRRSGSKVFMFHEQKGEEFLLPDNLIAEALRGNHCANQRIRLCRAHPACCELRE